MEDVVVPVLRQGPDPQHIRNGLRELGGQLGRELTLLQTLEVDLDTRRTLEFWDRRLQQLAAAGFVWAASLAPWWSLTVFALDAQWEVRLDITPDEYEPFATLSAFDEGGDEVAQARVAPDFRLNIASATAWIVGGFGRPGGKAAFDD